MPILERGLKERSTEVKKKSSQIVGNMASLTDVKDLVPYLPRLLPSLKEVLVDPVPEARATAAKSLGTMVEKLGEDKFPSLVNELVHTLKSDTSGVDHQGAAQGLSEVLAGLGLSRLEGLLSEIVINATSPKSYVREGFISLLIYLPATFGQRFQPYLGRIITPILSGLADESEYVRDASLRAGQMIIVNYATKAVDLLLPELERGLFDDNWRIRQSSVQLMGDLLYRITGISGKTTTEGEEEEETGGTEVGRKALLQVLGKERRDRVLAALYIVRQDVSGIVRQSSMHVWKSIVSNTPRVVKEILPIMMGLIIRNLASPSFDKRQVAARTLGELVRKLGE
ncbi:2069_t:CDS:2, partial [Scutellospora calospora]